MPVIQWHDKNSAKTCSILYAFIPKTGGTALINHMKKSGLKILFHNENNPILGLLKCPTQHFHYELLDACFNVDKFSYSFAIVRHPLDRLRSDYVWLYRNRQDKTGLPSFDRFTEMAFDGYRQNPFILDNHIRPQHHFVGPGIQRVFKYEQGLDVILGEVLKDCGLKSRGDISIAPANSSGEYLGGNRTSGSVEVRPATREKIRRFYERDFELFGYE